MKSYKQFLEEEIANSVGGGNVATFDPKLTLVKRKPPKISNTANTNVK